MIEEKLRRFSFNQLRTLDFFVRRKDAVVTPKLLEQAIKLKGKSLGGVLSSLSRTKVSGENLIIPVGRARDGSGLQWRLNRGVAEASTMAEELKELLGAYQ